MKNKDVANLLTRMGTLLEIKGENAFKIRAYYKAADTITGLGEDIEQIKNEKRLSEIPGIGKTLEAKIVEYLETERLTAYEKLTKEIPESVLDVINIPTVGPKKAKLFFDELKIKNVDQLRKAATNGKLLKLEKIKQKTVDNILSGIKVVEQGQARMNLGKATRVADEVVAALKRLKEVKKIQIAGSLRRGRETIRDIDILVESKVPQKVMEAFVNLPQVSKINVNGETKSSVLIDKNVQVDLRVVDAKEFGAALFYFTGSKNFNVKIRQIAMKKDLKVNEYGVFSVKGKKEKCVASKTEEDCFKVLGLKYVAPELREDRIFDVGAIHELPLRKERPPLPKLIEQTDIQGEVHVHSTYSDGRNTIEEMVKAAQKRGYSYLAISDHSERLRVARGVSVADLKKKRKEIDALNKKVKNFTVLMGSEVEIDSDGDLDYNTKVLGELDVVIGAVHSGFEQSSKQLTQRIIKAIKNKNVNIIAHPTGVHLGKREPYAVDFKEICKAAVDYNVFLEINAFPIRLDLNSQNVYYAKQLGVKFVINTDSHNIDHLEHMKYGIKIARRGWLEKKDVLNTRSVGAMMGMLKK